jgi:large subunit ribosomal protein L29
MTTEEIREMSEDDLHRSLEESRQELFNLRFQIATRKIKNHQRIPAVKRDIARIMTTLRERELMVMYGGADAEEMAVPTATSYKPERAGRRSSSGILGRFGRGNKK